MSLGIDCACRTWTAPAPIIMPAVTISTFFNMDIPSLHDQLSMFDALKNFNGLGGISLGNSPGIPSKQIHFAPGWRPGAILQFAGSRRIFPLEIAKYCT